jgi:hypoxanthine phosphoribosyltransferase
VAFAHNAEAELAALLDFYGIEWQYEPTTFVLEKGPDGCPTMAFTPDFYLPGFDCYVEVTTLDQRLVTRKNRKLRRLRELRPDVDVRIIYQRDYHHLLVKYGLAVPEQHADASGPGRAARPRVSAAETLGLLGARPVPRVDGGAEQTGAA